MPYGPYARGPVSMAAAGFVAVVALSVGILLLTDRKSSQGAIFIAAAVVAAVVAVSVRPR